jgi:hypothetical protein
MTPMRLLPLRYRRDATLGPAEDLCRVAAGFGETARRCVESALTVHTRPIPRVLDDEAVAAAFATSAAMEARAAGHFALLVLDHVDAATAPRSPAQEALLHREGADPDDPPDEPGEEDIFGESPTGPFRYLGRVVATTRAELRAWMAREQYWPAVWWVSDHGNAHPLTLDPKED